MAQDMAQQRRCYRSRDAYVAGVCAGIAKYLDFDPIVIRILAILLTAMTVGVAGIVYVVLWIRLPIEPEHTRPYDVTPEFAESSAYGHVDVNDRANPCFEERDRTKLAIVPRLAVAVCLMMLFLVVSIGVAPIVSGTFWWQFWPLGLLMAGLCLIVIPIPGTFETPWHAVGIIVTSFSALLLPMSLGVVSWATIPYAASQLWPLIVWSLTAMIVGYIKSVDALIVMGAFCIALLCVGTLMAYSLPGAVDVLFIQMPDGSLMRIAPR